MCNHKRWVAGKMIDLVGSDQQIWQEGFHEDTLIDIDITSQRCQQCGERFDSQGITSTDIKRKEDGTRVINGFYRS